MFEKTKLGMTFRAIISDREMVGNLGINVALLYSIMFMFAVWMSGVAGVLMAPIMGIVVEKFHGHPLWYNDSDSYRRNDQYARGTVSLP